MNAYVEIVFSAQRVAVLCMLVAFVITFAVTRAITRRIRADRVAAEEAATTGGSDPPDGAPGASRVIKDIEIRGVHIHHQVWGLMLMLAAGMLSFAFEVGTPWLQILAAVFGMGAALVLDEFALWLHLDDVYWSAEGQKSVDAILATVLVMTALALGYGPFGVSLANVDEAPSALAVGIAINIALVIVTLAKGKIMMATVGFFVPLVSLFGAVRLARVPSWWARRFYASRPVRLERARAREVRRRERTARVRARLAGQPDPPPLGAEDDPAP